jgi:uncharacterized protein involved in exopolysaccharide biosynthesis
LIVETSKFEFFEFVDYARSRWRFLAVGVGTAVLAVASAAWFLPSRYTATASILIDAPGGLDPRAATAVSPVYLESLRTYEHFASSDTLFAEATARLHIREQYAGVALESLKSRVLRVRKPRDTKILEIGVTLTDPKKAQALAQYIAERTVSMNSSLDRSADDDLAQESRARVNAAKARLASADRELAGAAVEGTEALRSEIEGAVDLDARLRRDLAEARADLAEFVGEEQAGGTAGGEQKRARIAALNARIAELERQRAAAQTAIQGKGAALGKRESRLDSLRQEQTSARAELETAMSRLNEITVATGLRSERLKIIDPGIVPERPSSPNRPVLVFAALLISTVLSLIYIAVAFHFGRPRIHERERSRAFG